MLENTPYCALLYTRAAEVKALGQLAPAAKDRIFPIMVWRPWPNAKHLAMTWKRMEEAFGRRRFGFDLDYSKFEYAGRPEASAEFDALFDRSNGFENYYELLGEIDSAIPVLQPSNHDFAAKQIENAVDLDRGLIVRIQYGRASQDMEQLRQAADEIEDIVVLVDAGWSVDLLGREAWASGIVSQLAALDAPLEIVVTGSSFPDAFAHLGKRGESPLEERALYSNLARRHNAAQLIYGDWGSTRPPYDPTPMSNVPRIDLPTQRGWTSFRRVEEEDYQAIAKRVISDRDWPTDLNIWGTYAISSTAAGVPGAIKSPNAASAARINIHLHRQALFDIPGNVSDVEEPYIDD